MATCKNCFLFDENKLNFRVGYSETRRDMLVFLLNVIMNVKCTFFSFVNVTELSVTPAR